MLKDFQTEIKVFLIVAVVAVILVVGGILLLKTMQPTPSPTPTAQQTPPPAPSQQSQTLDTSTWQTYRNEEFGFEVRYPKDWFNITLADVVGGSWFQFSNEERFSVESGSVAVQVSFGGDLDLFNVLRNAKAGETIEKNLVFYTKIRNELLAGYPAVRYIADYKNIPAGFPIRGEEVLINKDNKIIHFTIWGYSSQAIQENQNIYDQILSTFRFTP